MIAIDVEALAAALAQKVGDALRPIVRDEVRAARAEEKERALEPLAAILGVSAAAARMRLSRDADLRALGLRVGRRLMFRRADVEAFLAERTRGERS